jgi:hypothetical protein
MSARKLLSWRLGVAGACAALLSVGCDTPLKTESLIQDTRVLGARVEVAGDPERASPAPGEQAHLRVFVAAPSGALNIAYALSLCGVTPTESGFPSCGSAPFASALQASPAPNEPELDFEVPANLALSVTPHGFVGGIICPGDAAELSSDGQAHCSSGPGDAMAFEFDFAGPGEDNDNPTFTPDSLTLDGASWSASAADASCPGTLSEVHAGTKHEIGVRMQDSDFDTLLQLSPEDPSRETLLVSQFSDAGQLANTFSSLTPDTPGLRSDVDWDAPTQADVGGAPVHFYFVVRDARGGEDFATRALCVVP